MLSLQIRLFGNIQVQFGGEPTTLAYDKVRALLAFLLVESDRPQRRETLAGLLWPKQTDREARHGLSQALLKLRQAVDRGNGIILADRNTVHIDPVADIKLDTAVFTDALQQCQTHKHAQPNLCASCMAWRETAVSLYKGPFLTGLSLADAPEFEQWLTQQREHYHRQVMDSLVMLTVYHEQRGEFEKATDYAQRQLALEPWREETHRQLMRLFALRGQRSLALKQYEQCRAILQQEFGADPAPETEMISNQIRLRANFSLHNLPSLYTLFIGREEEMATILELLTETAVRLITITGMGGVGKTRLALAVARQFLHAKTGQPTAPFADGVYFIELAPLQRPTQIETAVAETLNINLQGHDPRQQLLNYLNNKQMLLIFDNFEHITGGAPLITALLQAAPQLSVLATSRTKLRLRGEKLVPLNGLGYQPPSAQNDPVNDAAQLFVAVAQQVVPEHRYSPDDLAQINEICRLVEGIPLAVELAAQWVDSMPLAAIADELQAGMAVLNSDMPDLPLRHRSMEAVFETSWQRLPPQAQEVLAKASIFQGGFTLGAATAVASGSNALLAQLVSHSLLRFDSKEQRYYSHELLRQFAGDRLAAERVVADQTRQKHLDYYCQLALQGEEALRGGDTLYWMRWFTQEQGNIQVAFSWGFANDLERAAQLALSMHLYYFAKGRTTNGEQLYQKLLSREAELLESTRGWVLTWYIALLWIQGRMEETKRLTDETYRLFQRLEDTAGLFMSHHHYSIVAFSRGDVETAVSHSDQAFALLQGDPTVSRWFLFVCLNTRFNMFTALGKTEDAYRLASECLQICQELDSLMGEPYALGALADDAIARNDFVEAEAFIQRALAIAQDLNDRRMEAAQYVTLGEIELLKRDFVTAVRHLETGVAIAELINNSDTLQRATMHLGDAYQGAEQFDLALRSFLRCATINQRLNHLANLATSIEKIATAYWQLHPSNAKPVRWLAAVATWREQENNPFELAPILQLIKDQLPETDFAQSWQAGRCLTLNNAYSEINASFVSR